MRLDVLDRPRRWYQIGIALFLGHSLCAVILLCPPVKWYNVPCGVVSAVMAIFVAWRLVTARVETDQIKVEILRTFLMKEPATWDIQRALAQLDDIEGIMRKAGRWTD